MLDAGGGGGYAGTTNWFAYNTEQMWLLIKNQETDNHWKQVAGWRKIAELTSTHAWRVKEYRDNLAAAWPPEKNEAARAFIERLDYLIQHVEAVHEVASANYTTFSTATGDIYLSRYKLKEIYDEYVIKKRQKLADDAAKATTSPTASPTPSPSPGPSPTPKVTQTDLEQLDNKSRSIMYSLSSTLVQSTRQIKQPPPYKPSQSKVDSTNNSDAYGNGSGSANHPKPPYIPPLVPVPVEPPPILLPPVAPPPTIPVITPTPPGVGPVLGGVGPMAPPAPINPVAPGVLTPTPPALPGVGPGFTPGMPPVRMMPGGGGVGSSHPGSSILPRGAGGPGRPGIGGGVIGAPRAMPPGGMIGGIPGGGLGQSATGAPGARRINPVGGVIGGGTSTSPMAGTGGRPGTGRTPAGTAGRVHGGPIGGRATGRRDEDEHGQHWDPDNPWETEEGVAPVVLPAQETDRIDPGPAIGFNR